MALDRYDFFEVSQLGYFVIASEARQSSFSFDL